MSRYIFSPATQEDNEAILELMAIPMPGLITLAMERAPDYFMGAHVQNQELQVFVCKDQKKDHRLVGVFSVGRRKVYVNGRKEWLRYFSDLRIHPDYQQSLVLMRMVQYVRKQQILTAGEFAQTIVFSDNAIMKGLIAKTHQRSKRSMNLPVYTAYGEYVTYTVALKAKNRLKFDSDIHIRKAQAEDLRGIQDFHDQLAPDKQFYPCYDFSQLDQPYYSHIQLSDMYLAMRGEKLVGMLGTWDQKSFKQTIVVDYQQPLKALRPIANLFAPFRLPKAGSNLNYFSLHSILIHGNDPEIFSQLLDAVLKDYQGGEYAYFLCGLHTKDSLNQAFDHMRAKRTILGNHYLVTFEEASLPSPDSVFYLEVGRI